MNGNLKNIISYIKEVIELRNRNIYDVNDFLLALDINDLLNKYKGLIESVEDLNILKKGVFLKIKYINDQERKSLPTVPKTLDKYIEIQSEDIHEKMDNVELEISNNNLKHEYDEFKNQFMKAKEYNTIIDEYNDLYLKIYNFYKRITDYEEKIEFILGTNLLFWKSENGEIIKRHIFEATLSIDVDPFSNTISFSINDELKRGLVSDFLNLKSYKIKDNSVLYQFMDSFNEQITEDNSVDFNDAIAKFLNSISYNNKYCDGLFQNYKPDELSKNMTYVFNNIHIIIRNKNAKLWVEDLAKILEVSDKEKITSPILNLLDVDYNDNDAVDNLLNAVDNSEDFSEVLFPLATNDEQYKIVDRVRKGNIVLVQGPPGTGKSHTIANLISHFISEGKKVVVTSEKAKALEVIREKLPAEIRCLSLALLSSKGLDKDLEYSIEKVLKKQEELENLNQKELNIAKAESELKEIREEKKENRRKIIELMSLGTANHEDKIKHLLNGETVDYSLSSIAKWLSDNTQYNLIPTSDDEVFSYNNLIGLFENLNSFVDIIQSENYNVSKRVVEKEYLRDNSLSQLIKEVNNNNKYKIKNSDLKDAIIFEKLNTEIVDEIKNKLEVLSKINSFFDKEWILENIKYPVFIHNLREIKETIESENAEIYKVEKNNVECSIEYNPKELDAYLNSVNNIISVIGDKNELSWLDKIKCNGDIKIYSKININSRTRNANTLDSEIIKIVFSKLKYDKLVQLTRDKLNIMFKKDIFDLLCIKNDEFGKTINKLLEFIDSFINYSDKASLIDKMINTIINTKIFNISFDSMEHGKIKDVLSDLKYYAAKKIYESKLNNIDDVILSDYDSYNLKYLSDLIFSIKNCDFERTILNTNKLRNEIEMINKYHNLKETYQDFFEGKKNFIHNYVYEFDDAKRKFAVNNINSILKYNFINQYFIFNEQKIHILPELFNQKENLQMLEKNKVVQLIELKGWYHQIKKMTSSIRTSLGKWIISKRKYGKGTGKNANVMLHNMQKEMLNSKNAIPVWIMPVDKLIEQYPFNTIPQFDVLIMDESSQTSVLSISALTRGKKVIIVGDDKQISPISVGQSIEEINDLKVKYLQNNPWAHILEESTSIYDLVQTVCNSKKIVLTEHFRCLPEIINYSRYQFYNGDINPLKVRGIENTIEKPIRTIFVPDATCKKVGNNPYNIKEIERIIKLIGEIVNDPQYNNKSIGIIALQNSTRHIQKISELVMQTYGEKLIRERRIKVGDSYDFQGDERDVIILSMVVSSTNDKGEPYRFNSLTKNEFNRSFNVSSTRAREQMILVHSVTLDELNQSCNRYMLLNYCQNYDKQKQKSIEELFESNFEKDIYYTLKAKNINLIPQYNVGKYRIDFIVENIRGQKIAIECDGDRYHSIEQYSHDLDRQSTLERCGWKFVRIRASEYYYDREKAVSKMVNEINQYFEGLNGARDYYQEPIEKDYIVDIPIEEFESNSEDEDFLFNFFDEPIEGRILTSEDILSEEDNNNQ